MGDPIEVHAAAAAYDLGDVQYVDYAQQATGEEVPDAFERFAFSVGIEAWMRAVFACNQYIDSQAPWALRKTDPERMATVLGTLVAAVRKNHHK